MRLFSKVDWQLLFLICIILAFGITVLVSINSFEFPSYLIYIISGFILFFLFSQIDYRVYKSLDWFFYFICIVALAATFLFGQEIRGSTRWLNLGFFSIQASEIIKPFIILAFSGFALKLNLKKVKDIGIFVLFSLPLIFLVFKQPDLGNAIIYLVILLSILYSTKGNLIVLAAGAVFGALASPLIWHFFQDYQKQRILSFINPASDPLGVGYNLIQAIVTVGSGQFIGKGLGSGTQSTLRFLPERSTDFIFASLAEEIGFSGSIFILGAIFFLLLKILLAAGKSDAFGKSIAYGIFSLIFIQSLINIGMNIGLLPITGVTLPLVSQGGSSLIATMICLGIVSNISKSRSSPF